jgi:hypothetical protein
MYVPCHFQHIISCQQELILLGNAWAFSNLTPLTSLQKQKSGPLPPLLLHIVWPSSARRLADTWKSTNSVRLFIGYGSSQDSEFPHGELGWLSILCRSAAVGYAVWKAWLHDATVVPDMLTFSRLHLLSALFPSLFSVVLFLKSLIFSCAVQ